MIGAVEEERRLTQVADLCARIGEVLMASGAGAADVTATMQAVAYALGHADSQIVVTFTTLSVSWSVVCTTRFTCSCRLSRSDDPVMMSTERATSGGSPLAD